LFGLVDGNRFRNGMAAAEDLPTAAALVGVFDDNNEQSGSSGRNSLYDTSERTAALKSSRKQS